MGIFSNLENPNFMTISGKGITATNDIDPSNITLPDGQILVGDSNDQAAAVTMSGDVTITDTGVTAIKSSVALAGSPTTTTQSSSDNSTKIATTAMVQSAVTAGTTGLLDDRGNYDASGNTFPASGGSGTAGAILKGDIWRISVAGTLGGTAVSIGDWVRALVDTPGQTASNWAIAEGTDANGNISANNFLAGYTTTATAAGTTTLTVSSTRLQYFTGSTTQTVTLPVTSTLVTGQTYQIVNLSSGVVTVQSSGANALQAMAANTKLLVTCILTSGTGTASWDWTYEAVQAALPTTITAASQSDQETATSTTTFVSPARQQFHPSSTKGWASVTFSGAAPVLGVNYNFTSVTDNGTGDTIMTIATDMSSEDYAIQVTLGDQGIAVMTTKAAGSYRVLCYTVGLVAADILFDTSINGDQ